MNKSQILACPLTKLGLNAKTRNSLIMHIKTFEDPDFRFGHSAERRRLCEELANQYTVQKTIEIIDAIRHNWWSERYLSWFDKGKFCTLYIARLARLGLTQLDWLELPNSTVSLSVLKALGRQKLQDKSVLVLGTLSSTLVRELEGIYSYFAPDVTIKILLATSDSMLGDTVKGSAQSIGKTRRILKHLGFQYEDGLFLQERTRQHLAEIISRQENIQIGTAKMVVGIAERCGWVRGFVD